MTTIAQGYLDGYMHKGAQETALSQLLGNREHASAWIHGSPPTNYGKHPDLVARGQAQARQQTAPPAAQITADQQQQAAQNLATINDPHSRDRIADFMKRRLQMMGVSPSLFRAGLPRQIPGTGYDPRPAVNKAMFTPRPTR